MGISYSQTQTGAYALVLAEQNGKRRIPIIIGSFEAQSIAVQLEGLKAPRPLTHDLFYNFAVEYGIAVESVFIFRFEEGVFYSKLLCTNVDGKRVEFDARTSDAIALAMRFKAPICTTAEIMERTGVVFTSEPRPVNVYHPSVQASMKKKPDLQYLDIAELEIMLNEAVMQENYEQASEIRDEIKRRKRDA